MFSHRRSVVKQWLLGCTLLIYLHLVFLLVATVVTSQGITNVVNMNVGVVLDMDKPVAKLGLRMMKIALSDFYDSHPNYKTRLILNERDSKGDVVTAAAEALDLITNLQVIAIIGPVTSAQAQFIISLGEKTHVPIVSYSATSPFLSSLKSSYFIRACQNDSVQAQAIAAVIHKFGWRQAIPIYVDDEFGQGIIPSLVDALQEIDTRIPYRSVISPTATDSDITEELLKLMTMSTRVFIVHLSPSLGSRLFLKADQFQMMTKDYVWIVSNAVTNELLSLDETTLDSMQGVLGVRTYIPNTAELYDFKQRWKSESPIRELNALGFWAYDAATALSRAVEDVQNFGLEKSESNTSDIMSIGRADVKVSQIGENLHRTILDTKFKGLSGDFHLLYGQLDTPALEIINVVGDAAKSIGFWTPKGELVKTLDFRKASANSASLKDLGTIMWPGDSVFPPKGWVIPSNGNRLKIMVPVKGGTFDEYVKIERNPLNNSTIYRGFCIEVFEVVVRALPYPVMYDFIPFDGSYDDMISQVYFQKADAAVGDITIRANRSRFVDFTVPYSETGVSMVVLTENRKKSDVGRFFLEPMTKQLAWALCGFFLFNALVIWILEHKRNKHFKRKTNQDGSLCSLRSFIADQIGESLYFSFSAMVFAQRENIESNYTRFVVVIWFFVLLILTQSYTASLTSYLTVQQRQPSVTEIHELVQRGEYIGYQNVSFVLGILKQQGFDESKLISYSSVPEMFELLSKGRVAAVIDEIAYLKLFLAKYCKNYTMVDSVRFEADGFAFAFPIGSPLGRDVSKAMLEAVESGQIKKLFKAEISASDSNCQDTANSADQFTVLHIGAFRILLMGSVIGCSITIIIYFGIWNNREYRRVLQEYKQRGEAPPAVKQVISLLVMRFFSCDDGPRDHEQLARPNDVQRDNRHIQLGRDQNNTEQDRITVMEGQDGCNGAIQRRQHCTDLQEVTIISDMEMASRSQGGSRSRDDAAEVDDDQNIAARPLLRVRTVQSHVAEVEGSYNPRFARTWTFPH